MAEEPDLSFAPFRLERANERLWCGSEPLSLRPKAFRLLRYLAEHPKRLLTQEGLRKSLWQHDYVSDGLLRGYICTLREVLGDDAKNPRFIETAGGRGYRFIAPLTVPGPLPRSMEARVAPVLQPPSPFVGLQEELAHLHEALEQAGTHLARPDARRDGRGRVRGAEPPTPRFDPRADRTGTR